MSVAGVFRWLIKVPILVFAIFFVFNIFAFGSTYLRLVSVSNVVKQTAIENNFIPPDEQITLQDYMTNSMESDIVSNVTFSSDTEFSRRQFGQDVTAGVQADFRWITPLSARDRDGDRSVAGIHVLDGETSTEHEARTEGALAGVTTNIVIEYTVPGLKYYPDMN